MEKTLNSQFMRKTDELRSQEAWNWLKIVLLRKKRRNAKSTNSVSHPYVGCAEKERKHLVMWLSVMWLKNVRCLHKSSTVYIDMIGLV